MASLRRHKVRLTTIANTELDEILAYILDKFHDEINGVKLFDRLVDDALSLDFMPEAYRLVDAPVARKMGIRRKVSGAYSIIYAVRGDEVVVLHFYGNAMDINSRLNDPVNLFGE